MREGCAPLIDASGNNLHTISSQLARGRVAGRGFLWVACCSDFKWDNGTQEGKSKNTSLILGTCDALGQNISASQVPLSSNILLAFGSLLLEIPGN